MDSFHSEETFVYEKYLQKLSFTEKCVFIVYISFSGEASNFRNIILTNQKLEQL